MYVRLLVDEVLRRTEVPLVVLPAEALDSAEFTVHLGEVASSLEIRGLPSVTLRAVSAVAEQTQMCGRPLFLEGDTWLRQFASGGFSIPATLLIMRAHGQSRNAAKRASETLFKVVLRALARLRGNRVLVLTGSGKSRHSSYSVADPVRFAADPVRVASLRSDWDSMHEVAPALWAGVVGGLGERKNVALIAQAALIAASPVGLVLAGAAEEDESVVEEWVSPARAAGTPIVRLPGPLSESDFDAVIAALDVVVLAHSNEGPSGVFAKAMAAGTAVVASGARSLRHDAARSGGLAVWTELDAVQIANAIVAQARRKEVASHDLGSDEFATRLIGT